MYPSEVSTRTHRHENNSSSGAGVALDEALHFVQVLLQFWWRWLLSKELLSREELSICRHLSGDDVGVRYQNNEDGVYASCADVVRQAFK